MKKLPILRERWNKIKTELTKNLELKSSSATGIIYFEQAIMNYDKYIDFTTQRLQLKYFVACGKDGEPLEKPMDYVDFLTLTSKDLIGKYEIRWRLQCQAYQKALESVLFTGWELDNGRTEEVLLYKGHEFHLHPTGFQHNVFGTIKTIESLITSVELHPTPQLIKKLKL